MARHFKNLINGKWLDSSGKKTIESVNPANISEVVGIVPASEKTDIDEAVEAARDRLRVMAAHPCPEKGRNNIQGRGTSPQK